MKIDMPPVCPCNRQDIGRAKICDFCRKEGSGTGMTTDFPLLNTTIAHIPCAIVRGRERPWTREEEALVLAQALPCCLGILREWDLSKK